MNLETSSLDLSIPHQLGVRIRRQVSLAPLSTIRIGGAAEYFATATTTDQLLKLVRWARATGLPYFVLGGGSNILIADAGIRGLVIHNRCRHMRLDQAPCGADQRDDRPYLVAESGAAMAGLARFSVREGLTGLEWAVSVPGTVGGAIVGNAGAHGGDTKHSLDSALLLTAQGDIQEYTVADFDYAYRSSSLKEMSNPHQAPKPLRAGFGPVVLSANFRLARGDHAVIAATAEDFLGHRRRTQPVEPSLGSTFMNPPGDFAGRLIEQAGLKGQSIGGVQVSDTHANFLISPGGLGSATARDAVALMQHIQVVVEQRSGVRLIPEVQLAGEW